MSYRGIETYEVARARGPRHETRGNATIVFAPGILDDESWNAVSAFAAGEAHLAAANLYIDDVAYYETAFPVEVALGVEAHAVVSCYNDSDFDQYLKVYLEFIDPDGDSQGRKPTTRNFLANSASTCYSYDVIIDKPGIWKIHGTVETT